MKNWRIRSNQDLVKLNARISPKQCFNIPQRNNKEKASVADQRNTGGGHVKEFSIRSGT